MPGAREHPARADPGLSLLEDIDIAPRGYSPSMVRWALPWRNIKCLGIGKGSARDCQVQQGPCNSVQVWTFAPRSLNENAQKRPRRRPLMLTLRFVAFVGVSATLGACGSRDAPATRDSGDAISRAKAAVVRGEPITGVARADTSPKPGEGS